MHVTGLTIELGGPPFGDGVDFRLDKRVNVFAGPNASGKSSLLRMLSMPVHDGFTYGGGSHFQYVCQYAIEVSEDWPLEDLGQCAYAPRWTAVPWVQIPATRLSLPWSSSATLEKPAYKGEENPTLDSIFRHGYDLDLFDASQVEKALQLLVNEAQDKPDKGGLGALVRHPGLTEAEFNLQMAMYIGYHCAQSITSEILTGPIPHNLVTGDSDFRDELFIKYLDVRLGMAVDIVDGDSIAANVLSSGTQSSLLWTRFLALQMLYHYNFANDWYQRPAILLIDEIENHLHPTWQRRVIPALLKHFPGLQVFATTHSPFVVAGLKAGQVHLLNRDENGVVTATTTTEHIEGWTADEILRVFMGVEEPTDEPTAQAAQQLRRLRDEGPRADEQEENERQSEITRLRHIVDRAALSGPRAAEDARFLADLRSILQRYSQQQDLNQENG